MSERLDALADWLGYTAPDAVVMPVAGAFIGVVGALAWCGLLHLARRRSDRRYMERRARWDR